MNVKSRWCSLYFASLSTHTHAWSKNYSHFLCQVVVFSRALLHVDDNVILSCAHDLASHTLVCYNLPIFNGLRWVFSIFEWKWVRFWCAKLRILSTTCCLARSLEQSVVWLIDRLFTTNTTMLWLLIQPPESNPLVVGAWSKLMNVKLNVTHHVFWEKV